MNKTDFVIIHILSTTFVAVLAILYHLILNSNIPLYIGGLLIIPNIINFIYYYRFF